MPLHKNLSVHFVVPYPINTAPGQRFRFEQYLKFLDAEGFTIRFSSFVDLSSYKILYQGENPVRKLSTIVVGFFKRFLLLPVLLKADYVFLFREAAPVGPPIFEWIIAKILSKKIIYDFDDAIWLTDKTSESMFEKALRWRTKVRLICKWSYKISCGNEYLCNFAHQYNKNVILIPTTIDTEKVHNPALYNAVHRFTDDEKIIIGWTGSHSTLKYLGAIESVLQNLEMKYQQLEFWVIADKSPQLELKCLRFKPWSLKSEIADLAEFDIGIMPLPDDEWANGKCGFKVLQYMALQIPAIASPVGVNRQIIQSGINGYLCDSLKSWEGHLMELIENKALRNSIGIEARNTVIERYSVLATKNNFIGLLK